MRPQNMHDGIYMIYREFLTGAQTNNICWITGDNTHAHTHSSSGSGSSSEHNEHSSGEISIASHSKSKKPAEYCCGVVCSTNQYSLSMCTCYCERLLSFVVVMSSHAAWYKYTGCCFLYIYMHVVCCGPIYPGRRAAYPFAVHPHAPVCLL